MWVVVVGFSGVKTISTFCLKEIFLLINHRGIKRKCQYFPWLGWHSRYRSTSMGKSFDTLARLSGIFTSPHTTPYKWCLCA